MFEARELYVCLTQRRLDPLEVLDACGVHLGFEYQTLRIYE
jgi:hypothetical protein